jgi:uncharacterized protein (DUF1015 family)
MRLYAFSGLRYTGKVGDGAGKGALVAPPYDQIDDAARDRYHALSPHQFAHLIKPLAAGALDPYQAAAALHSRWLEEGTIAPDSQPALYPYVIVLAGGSGTADRRLGVCGLAELADAREIRPHEQTLDKPLADRLALLRATHVDLLPARRRSSTMRTRTATTISSIASTTRPGSRSTARW